MNKYKVLQAFELDGVSYSVDQEVELSEEQVKAAPEGALDRVVDNGAQSNEGGAAAA